MTTSFTRYPTILNSSNAVTSINGLVGNVTLVAGSNITITPSGQNLIIAATGGGGGGIDTVGTFDGGTPNADGAFISGTSIFFQSADATNPGMVNLTTQTFAGNKTLTGTLTLSALTASRAVVTNGSKVLLSSATTATEIGFVNGVTSSIQTQLDSKQATLTIGDLTDAGTDGITIGNGTGSVIGSGTTISQHVADATHNGYLLSTDWVAFNAKQSATLTSAHLLVGNGSNVATDVAASGDLTLANTGAFTLATVNSNVGTFASVTVNGKGLATAAGNLTGDITSSGAATTLATVNGNVGSFTNANITVNAKGLITAAANGSAGSGSVTSVALSVPATSLFGVSGSPVTTSGTLGLTTTGTSGGIPYFSSSSALNTSAVLTAGALVLGGGAGSSPTAFAAGTDGQFLKSMNSAFINSQYVTQYVNYIGNAFAETNTNGWATYADAAGNIPVDGTGGSATNLTFSRSTSSPIRGAANFQMVQANSTSLQGKGVSYDLTIDSADQAKALSVSFDFNASSTFVASNGITAPLNDGTTTTNAGNSDIEVFVYDKTNAALIYVSPEVITANGANNFSFKGIFQTASNSTSYRLIFHVATTSANATGWTFKYSNVYLGPQVQVQAPPITDFVAYTPTIQGFGTLAGLNAVYRRVGDSIDVFIHTTTGTVTGSVVQITLPPGLTIDSAKFPLVQTVGRIERVNGSASTVKTFIVKALGGNNYLTLGYDDYTSGTTPSTDITGTNFSNAEGQYIYAFNIPITGWSSTVQMSNDASQQVIQMTAVLNSTYATGGTNQVIKYDTVLNDSTGGYSTSGGNYTVPVAGSYRVSTVNLLSASTSNVYITINGTGKIYLNSAVSTGFTAGSATVNVKAGDLISVFSTASVTFSAVSSGIYQNTLSIERISGPSQLAVSDSVAMRYFSSSTSISGSLATITYATKDFDTSSGYASGTFTVPIAGKYQVNVGLLITGTIALNNNMVVEIQKNGTVVSRFTEFFPATLTDGKAAFADIISCIAGDTLRVQASSSVTGPSIVSSNFDNYLSIMRLGL